MHNLVEHSGFRLGHEIVLKALKMIAPLPAINAILGIAPLTKMISLSLASWSNSLSVNVICFTAGICGHPECIPTASKFAARTSMKDRTGEEVITGYVQCEDYVVRAGSTHYLVDKCS